MPNFEWADVTGIITPETLVAIAIGGILVAAFMWQNLPGARRTTFIGLWAIGAAFLLMMAVGRWADLSKHWESWLGTTVLWTVYVGVAHLCVWKWRKWRTR